MKKKNNNAHMKKITFILFCISVFFSVSCTTTTTDRSYELGKAGKFDTILNFVASKEDLRQAMITALTVKKWNLKREGDAIRASIDHGGVSGRLYITFDTDTININSKGSNIDGTPIGPLRLIDNLTGVVKKQLLKK